MTRYWLVAAVVLLAAAVLLAEVPAWAAPTAAPAFQTVPRPTPTRGGDDGPGATATPRGNGDGGNGAPAGGQPGAAAPAGETPAPELIFLDNTAAPGAATGAALTGIVTVGALNVRSSPSAGANVVGVVRQNESVTVLARDSGGTWWLICCVAGSPDGGWVSAQFIQPNFDPAQVASLLPVLDGSADATAAAIRFPTPTPGSARPFVAAEPTSLELTLESNPPFVWQGAAFELRIVVSNTGTAEAVNVEFSDELPAGIRVLGVEAESADAVVEVVPTASGGTLVVVQWPTLAAGQEVAAVASLAVATDIAEPVVENLAAVGAGNAQALTVAADIGLPPVLPPAFR